MLVGQCNAYLAPLRPNAAGGKLVVRLKRRGGGEPLLMVRFGASPPSVPRKAKVVADAWDQEAFDSGRTEHCVAVTIPDGCEAVSVGVHNCSGQHRET